jgi:hypothetical protein
MVMTDPTTQAAKTDINKVFGTQSRVLYCTVLHRAKLEIPFPPPVPKPIFILEVYISYQSASSFRSNTMINKHPIMGGVLPKIT